MGVDQINTTDVALWSAESGCVYVGMTEAVVPKCVQLGTFVDVQNDALDPNICEINLKRD